MFQCPPVLYPLLHPLTPPRCDHNPGYEFTILTLANYKVRQGNVQGLQGEGGPRGGEEGHGGGEEGGGTRVVEGLRESEGGRSSVHRTYVSPATPALSTPSA